MVALALTIIGFFLAALALAWWAITTTDEKVPGPPLQDYKPKRK